MAGRVQRNRSTGSDVLVLVSMVRVAVAIGLLSIAPSVDRPAAAEVGRHAGWVRAVRSHGLDPDRVTDPFRTSPEMEAWVRSVVASETWGSDLDRLALIQRALFDADAFDFVYDEGLTLTAEQAFIERRGNCLSFTVLFVALSRSVGIDTFLVAVERDPEVERDGDLVVINRHVVAGYRSGSGLVTFDFTTSSTALPAERRVIDDVRASAMFHANVGGAELRVGDNREALRHLEIATRLAPDWSSGWVNLGVALARLGDDDRAFAAYRNALVADPGNASALNNLSALYARSGRTEEATIALRAAAETTDSPFTLIAIADSEIMSDRPAKAARFLLRARRQHPRQPEVFDALARLAYARGHTTRGDRFRARADRLREQRAAD
jgi:Flp pilus assembly protein TadD